MFKFPLILTFLLIAFGVFTSLNKAVAQQPVVPTTSSFNSVPAPFELRTPSHLLGTANGQLRNSSPLIDILKPKPPVDPEALGKTVAQAPVPPRYAEGAARDLKIAVPNRSGIADVEACDSSASSLWRRMRANPYSTLDVTQFDTNCYLALGNRPADVTPATMNVLTSVVGVLATSSPFSGFCTAVRIAKTRIVTSRHCFFTKGDGSTGSRHVFLQNGLVRFFTMGQILNASERNDLRSETGFRVQRIYGKQAEISPFTTDNDILILHLEDRVDIPAFPQIGIQPPEVSAPLVVAGLLSEAESPYWWKNARWSSGRLCMVYLVVDGCIFHGCNSLSGFSGTPLIAIDGHGRTSIVGIHSDSVMSDAFCRKAVRANQTIRAQFQTAAEFSRFMGNIEGLNTAAPISDAAISQILQTR